MTDTPEGEQQAPPPQVIVTGEAGFDPAFPVVGSPITYYWSEVNIGGPTPDTYNARVLFKNDDQVIDDVSVECTKLETNEAANRTTQLSAPTTAGIGYSIELWVDIDHNYEATTANYAYHAVTVDES